MKKKRKVNKSFNCYIEPKRPDIERHHATRGRELNEFMAGIKRR